LVPGGADLGPYPRNRPARTVDGMHDRAETLAATGAVVVGYDEHPVSLRALDWAADEAVRSARPLVVVHATGGLGTVGSTWLELTDPATEPTLIELERHGQAVLARAVAHVGLRHPSLRISPQVAMGEPAPELLRQTASAHLVVVGSRGHGVSRSIPSGQVGTWLARRTAGPVVVVPDYNPLTVRQGVLVGVPIGEDVATVLDFAFRHASLHDLPLTVVHATKDATSTADIDRPRHLSEALGGLAERFPEVRIRSELVPGRPARTLLRLAERMNLLVVGQHTATGLHELPMGHVRASIVDRAPCPTAVVPTHVPEPA